MNVCTSKSFFSYIIILLLTIIFKEKMVGCSCNKDFYQIYRDLANEGKGVSKEKNVFHFLFTVTKLILNYYF